MNVATGVTEATGVIAVAVVANPLQDTIESKASGRASPKRNKRIKG